MSDKNLQHRAENITALFDPNDPRDAGKIDEFKKLGKDIQIALRKSEVSESIPVKMFRQYLMSRVDQERAVRGTKRQWIEKEWNRSWEIEDLFLELCRWWDVDTTKYEKKIQDNEELFRDLLEHEQTQ